MFVCLFVCLFVLFFWVRFGAIDRYFLLFLGSGSENPRFVLQPAKAWSDALPALSFLERIVGVMWGCAEPKNELERNLCRWRSVENTDERLINSEHVYAHFIVNARIVMNCIGRIKIGSKPEGTGFRVSERLIMTAAHVAEKLTANSSIEFHYYEQADENSPAGSSPPERKVIKLEKKTFCHISNKNLDYAIVAMGETVTNFSDIGIIKHLCLEKKEDLIDFHINILSHPYGGHMMASLRKNIAIREPRKKEFVTLPKEVLIAKEHASHPHIIFHEADVDHGSSGAPMFNDDFQLVGIHLGFTGIKVRGQTSEAFLCNRGCLIDYILRDMYSDTPTDFQKQLKGKEATLGVPFNDYLLPKTS